MATIKHLHIQSFRSIRDFSWWPNPGLNCLIGPGDSGKSTILDAVDLVLGARRSYAFNDADFYQMATAVPITITVTLGELEDDLKNIEAYGHFFRGFDPQNGQIHDEPRQGDENVLTLQLIVREDLDPEWLLYSERAAHEGIEKRLQWKHRELIHPNRLGAATHQHFAWGNRSILNKLSEDAFDVTATLAQISRQTRNTFAQQPMHELTELLTQVREIAHSLGVPVGELKALLDVKGVALSNGAISLHNSDDTPLRSMGTGSSRLLISGLQKAASRSKIILVDEAEYGLEPYRIGRLLGQLGAKADQPSQQVIITTHSPYVLRELKANQLHVLRKITPPSAAPPPPNSHTIQRFSGSNDHQGTLRACPEGFLSKAVIVGEGSTEVGLVRGLDLHFQDHQIPGFQDRGLSCVDGGGGNNYFRRAEVFAQLGYPTALLKDSDIPDPAHQQQSAQCQAQGVTLFEWGYNLSTEGAVFHCCPIGLIPDILSLAADFNGPGAVDQHIRNCSNSQFTYQLCTTSPTDQMRSVLAQAAGDYKWFKTITKSEELARRIIGPNLAGFGNPFQGVITALYAWAGQNGDQR